FLKTGASRTKTPSPRDRISPMSQTPSLTTAWNKIKNKDAPPSTFSENTTKGKKQMPYAEPVIISMLSFGKTFKIDAKLSAIGLSFARDVAVDVASRTLARAFSGQ